MPADSEIGRGVVGSDATFVAKDHVHDPVQVARMSAAICGDQRQMKIPGCRYAHPGYACSEREGVSITLAVEELTLVFRHGTLDAGLALNAIQAELAIQQIPSIGFELYEVPVNLADVLPRLKRAARKTFYLRGHGFTFHLSSVRNPQLDFLGIAASDQVLPAWDRWASSFI